MLKLMGALAVFCGLSWWGIDRGRWYGRRVECLRRWQNALLEGERMLCDLGASTPDYLQMLTQCPVFTPVAQKCMQLLAEEERLEPAWRQAVDGAELPLTEDELRALRDLGSTLGRYDGEEQRRVIRAQLSRLETFLARAEEEKSRLSRMWSVLGLSCGALAVVLLY